MPSGFTQQEFDIAKQLVDIALANAAASFSTITKDMVTFRHIELNPENIHFQKQYISAQDHLFILLTEFKGEIPAESFLILNPASALATAGLMYPQPNLSDTMRDAILLELDNILSASVATKFADILGKDMKGDVPQLIRKNFIQAQRYIDNELQANDVAFSLVAMFQSEKLQLEAKFVCAFKEEFAVTVKSIAQDVARASRISQQHKTVQTQKFMKV